MKVENRPNEKKGNLSEGGRKEGRTDGRKKGKKDGRKKRKEGRKEGRKGGTLKDFRMSKNSLIFVLALNTPGS